MNQTTPRHAFALIGGEYTVRLAKPARLSSVGRLTGSTSMLLALAACGGSGGIISDGSVGVTKIGDDEIRPTAPSIQIYRSSDTGISTSDNLSYDLAPRVRIELPTSGKLAAVGDTVTLRSNGVTVGAEILSQQNITNGWVRITTDELGTDGLKFLTATVRDQARVPNESAESSPISYYLDTTPPTASVATAFLDVGNNVVTAQSTEGTGFLYLTQASAAASATNLIELEALVASGMASKATVVAAKANISIATTDLSKGIYKVIAVDAAGNVSSASANTINLIEPINGLVIKGPLQSAFVFADINGDGIFNLGEPSTTTGADGSFTLPGAGMAAIVATTNSNTIDQATGLVLNGVTLKAPPESTVVSPLTTLVQETGLSPGTIAAALGVTGVDILRFNPYAPGVDPTAALAVEKTAQTVMATIRSVAAASEGAGLSATDAVAVAIQAVSAIVTQQAASGGDASLDFASSATVSAILTSATTAAAVKGADVAKLNAVKDAVSAAITNVNSNIAAVTDLSSTEAKATFATSTTLANETKAAANAGSAAAVTLNNSANLDAAIEDLKETVIEAGGGNEAANLAKPHISLYMDLEVLRAAEQAAGSDFKFAQSSIRGFYRDDGGLSNQISNIDLLAVNQTIESVDVDSTGILIEASNEYRLYLNFQDFKPNSLVELETELQKILALAEDIFTAESIEELEAIKVQSVSIEGALKYIEISRPGTISEGVDDIVVARLNFSNGALIWERPSADEDSVDTFIIGESDAWGNSSLAALSGEKVILEFLGGPESSDLYIGANTSQGWRSDAHHISISAEGITMALDRIISSEKLSEDLAKSFSDIADSVISQNEEDFEVAIANAVTALGDQGSVNFDLSHIDETMISFEYNYGGSPAFAAQMTGIYSLAEFTGRNSIEEALSPTNVIISDRGDNLNSITLVDNLGIISITIEGVDDQAREVLEEEGLPSFLSEIGFLLTWSPYEIIISEAPTGKM